MSRRKRMMEDLDQDIRDYIERETQDNIERGLSPEEARYAALRKFGNVARVKEDTWEVWGFVWLEQLWQDVRYGLRMLVKDPGFTIIAVLTLALGIAANSTIFSAVSALLLRKPPVKDPDRLITISSRNAVRGWDLARVSAPDFESWREESHAFEDMAAAEIERSFTLTGQGTPESVDGDRVTPNYFSVLGVMPMLGRRFLPSEGQAGNDRVVVLSYDLWRDRFGLYPNAIGKDIKIDGEPHTIVGIMPPEAGVILFTPPRLWTPLVFGAKDLSPSARGNRYLSLVLGRLKPGVTVQQAQAEIDSIAGRLARGYPDTNKDWGATVLTLQEFLIQKPNIRAALMMLMVMVGFVLLIACANIAGLLLARGAGRAHEMAVRSAVGASRLRLIRQMLAESLLIGAAGGGVGLMMSVWGISLLRVGFNFNSYGRQQAPLLQLDQTTLVFTGAVCLVTAVLFGLVPAIRASRINPGPALTEGGRAGSGSFSRSRMRSALVVGEIALGLALLAGAGVIAREVRREFSEKVGFNPDHLLLAEVNLKSLQYKDPAAQVAFFQQATEKLREIPGVESAAVTMGVPLGGASSSSFNIVGQPPLPEPKRPSADYYAVGPRYFGTMEIPLESGRDFSDSDNAQAPVVAIVNEEFARRFFPEGDAIGHQIEVDTGQHKPARIVGIVGNVNGYVGQLAPEPQIYETYLQIPFPSMSLVLRSPVTPSALAPSLRQAVRSIDKEQPVGSIETMKDAAAENEGAGWLIVALMGIFAVLALILGAVGIYGVIAYSISQRTREIGIRTALGARKKDVLGLVLRQGGLLIAAGCAVGLGLALPLPRVLAGIFEGMPLQGPLVPVVAGLTVAVVSLVATYIPARRAMKIDPMVALRYE